LSHFSLLRGLQARFIDPVIGLGSAWRSMQFDGYTIEVIPSLHALTPNKKVPCECSPTA
jgi:hypothetical protein